MVCVRVCHGSLTDGTEALLVNASNTNCHLGTGVSGAIALSCGKGYQGAIHEALDNAFGGPMEPGQTLITDAGAHPHARYVAHVAVMDYRDGFKPSSYPTIERLEACYRSLWEAIEGLEEKVTVAMVALGAGTGQVGLRRSVMLGCKTLQAHLLAQPETRIGEITYYGYELHEYVAMIGTVSRFFQVERDDIPDEAWELAQQFEQELLDRE